MEIENLKVISDCNDTSLKTGFYYCIGSALNTPFESAWFLQVMKQSDTNITQILYRYREDEIFVRQYNVVGTTGWKSWKMISKQMQACFVNNEMNRQYNSGDYIALRKTQYNNSYGKIVSNSDGTITIKHTGYIKVSFNIWLNSNSDARPWIVIKNYTRNITYMDVINTISSGYCTLSASNCIFPINSGEAIGMYCSTMSNQKFSIDAGNNRTTSYCTIELI